MSRRHAIVGAIQGLTAHGRTGLYDTVYNAYMAMQHDWRPDAVDLVLLITDGKNEQDTGLDRPTLIGKLRQASRPDHPLPVIAFAVGPQADADALEEISRVTGGRTFVVKLEPGRTPQGDHGLLPSGRRSWLVQRRSAHR